MDPNAALALILTKLSQTTDHMSGDDCDDVADSLDALASWIRSGGFVPNVTFDGNDTTELPGVRVSCYSFPKHR